MGVPISDIASNPPPFVLASGSPRRQDLLRAAGYTFDVHAAELDEDDLPPGTMPIDAAMLLAQAKANAVATRFPDRVVLAADTIVAFGDRIVGKADDVRHAKEIIRLLVGTTHVVITGVHVAALSRGFSRGGRMMSAVTMERLSEGQIERYLQTGAWRGKAGAYGLQDSNGLVRCVGGDTSNVVGLPMPLTRQLLADVGIRPAAGH